MYSEWKVTSNIIPELKVKKGRVCDNCSFFKTQKQVEESEKKATGRIESLDTHIRNNIINLYFLGGLR